MSEKKITNESANEIRRDSSNENFSVNPTKGSGQPKKPMNPPPPKK